MDLSPCCPCDSVSGSDQITWTYNRQGQKTSLTDQNGTVHAYDYDLLARETADRITTVGTGIDTAVLRISSTYEVRGMKQNLTSYDNATVGSGSIVNDVQFAYNSYWQLIADYQSHSGAVNVSTTPNVQYAYADGSANTIRPTGLTYPNGRLLNYDYGTPGGIADSASRIASLIDNDGVTHLADYSYLGGTLPSPSGRGAGGEGSPLPTLISPFNPDTVVQVSSPQPGIQYTLIGIQGGNDPITGDIYRGLDTFGRIKDLIWVPFGGPSSSSSSSGGSDPGTNLVRIQHIYDRMSNRRSRRDLVAESYGVGLDELYEYDLINRLNDLKRGTLNSGASAISPGSGTFSQCWTLDTIGNWSGFREDDTGSGTWNLVQSRTSNTVNEITAITNTVGSAWAQPKYDAAGSMTTVPQPANPTVAYNCTYDAWNRLVKAADAHSGNTIAQYGYDGAKRRNIGSSFTAGVLSETRHSFYTGPQSWRVVEERVGASTNAERQFVWGQRYIDDLVLRDRDATGSGTLNERLYGLQDPNWNLVAVVNAGGAGGAIQERYWYDAYGTVEFLTGSFAPRTASLFAWETLYAGYRLDNNTGLYSVRNRVLDPLIGWIHRDRLGFLAGPNIYEYVRSAPTALTDPLGLKPPKWLCGLLGDPCTGSMITCACGIIEAIDILLNSSSVAALVKAALGPWASLFASLTNLADCACDVATVIAAACECGDTSATVAGTALIAAFGCAFDLAQAFASQISALINVISTIVDFITGAAEQAIVGAVDNLESAYCACLDIGLKCLGGRITHPNNNLCENHY